MSHAVLANILEHQRQIVTAIGAILGALVATGVIQVRDQTAILSVAGILFAFLGGSAYVQGKHVESAAKTTTTAASTTTTTGGAA